METKKKPQLYAVRCFHRSVCANKQPSVISLRLLELNLAIAEATVSTDGSHGGCCTGVSHILAQQCKGWNPVCSLADTIAICSKLGSFAVTLLYIK